MTHSRIAHAFDDLAKASFQTCEESILFHCRLCLSFKAVLLKWRPREGKGSEDNSAQSSKEHRLVCGGLESEMSDKFLVEE